MRRWAGLLVGLALTACGATLTLGPAGWHEQVTDYAVAPLPDGKLFTPAWDLVNFAPREDGFRRDDDFGPDFVFRRHEDDGAMVVLGVPLSRADREKAPDVLADRWISSVVTNPEADDTWRVDFARVVPPLDITAHANFSLRTATAARPRTIDTKEHGHFAPQGGTGYEIVAQLAPADGTPDRGLYLAIARSERRGRYVIVAYGNTISRFEQGLEDARSFAHRLRF